MEKQMNFPSYIRAGFPFLWFETFEEERAIKELREQIEALEEKIGKYNIYAWDMLTGIRNFEKNTVTDCQDPFELLQTVTGFPEESIIFVKDFHRFLEDLQIVRKLKNLEPILESSYRHIIFISPITNIPIDLEKAIQVVDFGLPTVEALQELAKKIAEDNKMPYDAEAVENARGLTLTEAKNTFSRSLIMAEKYDRKIIEESKLQTVKKSGLMEIYTPVPIEEVGGLQKLKDYMFSRKRGFTDDKLPTPKGILLTGLPGSGKSLSAKAIASILGVLLVRLDMGTLKGGLVGQSEANMKRATAMIDAIAPCVVWMDEIEKALSGVSSSGRTDGGTGANMFGQLLTWMQESKSEKFIVATCNDIQELLALSQGALIRRFDDIFFVDLPSNNERKAILDIMIKRYGAEDLDFSKVKMDQWTGAEIEKFVRNAMYDGVEAAEAFIKPVAVQNKAIIEKAREWATYNAIVANEQDKATKSSGRSLKV